MAVQHDINALREEARKRGANMDWLQQPAAPSPQAAQGVGHLNPAAQQLIESIQSYQTASPTYIPFPGGTPTQRRREADTSAEQWGQAFGEDIRQFDVTQELREKQFAADERYRRGKGEVVPKPHKQEMVDNIYGLVQTAVQQGLSFSEVRTQLRRYSGILGDYKMTLEEADELAQTFYQQALSPESWRGGTTPQASPPSTVGGLPHIGIKGMESTLRSVLPPKTQPGYDAALADLQRFLPDTQIKSGIYQRPDGSQYFVDEMGLKEELDQTEPPEENSEEFEWYKPWTWGNR